MKHIEQIQPEYAAGDLSRLLVSETDATASAALSRLLHDWTGCAIPPTADTPQSEVEELVPLCLSILRRHWTTPLTALGDGTTPMSLADLLRRLIGDRVQGNEAWSIPPANANIPTVVAALTKRHIDDGLTMTLTDGGDGSTPTTMPLPDGLSLAQLLCGSDVADSVTELKDENKGWTMSKAFPWGLFPNVERVTLGCGKLIGYIFNDVTLNTLQELNISDATYYEGDFAITLPNGVLVAPKLTEINVNLAYGNCFPLAKVLYFPKVTKLYGYNRLWQTSDLSILQKIVLGSLNNFGVGKWDWVQGDASNLMHMEYGADGGLGLLVSQDLSWWTATECLRTDTDAEDYVDLREDMSFANNLEQFLANFKTYIANRLTDKGSGLTLTLSQAVRDAIQQDPDIVSIITSKGWTISPAPSV